MDIESTIEKIIEKTGWSKDEIKEKIDNNIQEMSGLIDEEGALILVAKKAGVDLKEQQGESSVQSELKIGDLKPRIYATIAGRIRSIGELKKFNKKDGSEGVLLPFVVADTSGMIRCVAWDHNTNVINENGFAKDTIIRIVNGFVKEGYYDGLEISIGNKSRIQIEPSDIDMTLMPQKMGNKVKITPLSEISLKMPLVNIEEKITFIGPIKEYTSRKTGNTGTRASLGIGSGDNVFFITFWNEDTKKLEKLQVGQIVRLTNLKPKKHYRDDSKIDLSLTSTTEIQVIEEAKEDEVSSGGLISIQELINNNQSRGIKSIECKIVEVEEKRTVSLKNGTEKDVQSFIVADHSGSIKLNLWGNDIKNEYKEGANMHIDGIYTRFNSYSNQMEANLSRRGGSISLIDKDIDAIEVNKRKISTPKSFSDFYDSKSRSEIEKINSSENYQFKGTVVKELNRIYIYNACSECGRKIDNCSCEEPHEEVNRMVLNCVVDDGTSTVRVTFFGDEAEEFLGDSADLVHEKQLNGTFDQYLKEKNKQLLGREFIFTGKGKYSDYTSKYEVSVSSFQKIDPIKESKRIIELIENQQ